MAKRTNTYGSVLRNIPKADRAGGWTPERREAVDTAAAPLQGKPASEVAAILADLERDKAWRKAGLSALEIEIDAAEGALAAAMAAEGVEQVRLATGDLASLIPTPSVSYDGDDGRERFRLWGIANGYAQQMTLSAQTRDQLAKDALLSGTPIPDGLTVKAWDKIKLTLGDV